MLLAVREVSKRFGGLQVLHKVSLEVARGEIVGLIGPNGAGKTTLFNLISGFLRPDEGEIRFDGRPIQGLPPHAICKAGIARTFQIVQTFGPMSVHEAVTVAALNRTRSVLAAQRRAFDILNRFGLEHKAFQPCNTLTPAEQKRLELVRAFATEPRLILMDECMAGLTETEASAMMATVREIKTEGIALIVVEHVMRVVMSLCEKIYAINFGKIIAHGTPQEVSDDREVIRAYLGDGEMQEC